MTLVAAFAVCLISVLTLIGLASTAMLASTEFHAYASLTIGLVPAVTIIAVIMIGTSLAFKQPIG